MKVTTIAADAMAQIMGGSLFSSAPVGFHQSKTGISFEFLLLFFCYSKSKIGNGSENGNGNGNGNGLFMVT